MHRAALLLENAERSLREAHPELKRITVAGDLRRGCELVADLSLVAEVPRWTGTGNARAGGRLTVHLTDKRHYGMTLLLATGSAQHIEELRALAVRKGLTLDGDGLRRGHKLLAAKAKRTSTPRSACRSLRRSCAKAAARSSAR